MSLQAVLIAFQAQASVGSAITTSAARAVATSTAAAAATTTTTAAAATTSTVSAATTTTAAAAATATATSPPSPPIDWGALLSTWTKKLSFEEWPSPLFEADFWRSTLYGVSIALPLILASLLLFQFAVRRGKGRIPQSVVKRLSWVFVSLGFLLYYDGFNPNTRHPGFYDPAAFYQQYMGAKYAAELNNSWLFDCTLTAEKELHNSAGLQTRYIRNRAFPEQLIAATSAVGFLEPSQCTDRFTSQRWQAFKTDVGWFTKAVKPKVWATVQQARWFVASPGWMRLVRPWVQAPASELRFRSLALLKPALHLAALAAMYWGFGPVTAAVGAVVWGAQPFAAFAPGAGLLNDAWIPILLIGLCAWRQHRLVAGAALLAVCAALHPPALVVVLGVLAWTFAPLAHRQPVPRARLTGLGALILFVSLAFGVSLGTPQTYRHYTADLQVHASLPELSDVGLGPLLASGGQARYRFTRNDAAANPAENWSLSRSKRLGEIRLVRNVLLVGFGLLLIWIAATSDRIWIAASLGLVALTAWDQPLTAAVGLLPLVPLCQRCPQLSPALLVTTAGCQLLWTRTHFPDDRAAVVSCLLLLGITLSLLAISPLARRYLAAGNAPIEPRRV